MSLEILSAASAGERKGPVAKQWEGEVVHDPAMVSLMRCYPGLSHAEFADHWTQRHAPLALRRHAGLEDYRQHVVDETLTADTPEIDGVAVLGFVTRAEFDDRFFDSDAGRAEIMEDVARFMDRPGPETTLVGPVASTRASRNPR